MRILIAPDKFKGSLSASEAASALARGFKRVWPEAEMHIRPIADGGEGTARALCDALDGIWITCSVHDPLGELVDAGYAWIPERPGSDPMAVIEMSEASGLWRVPPERRRAREANTFGTGELIRDAMKRGARRIIVGLGGSATSDGGTGMAAALGYEFLTSDGEVMEHPAPANLLALERIELNEVVDFPEIIAACDVQNPLLGPRGTAHVFAAQKGADASDIQTIEWALEHLAELGVRDLSDLDWKHEFRDHRDTPGAGAAGGLGYGLLMFCGATIRPGFDIVAEILNLPSEVAVADLVVTGEGSLDEQTLEGKGPAGVAALARRHGKPVVGFAGRVQNEARLLDIFDAVVPIPNRPMPLNEAIADAASLLEQAAERAARLMKINASFLAAR